MTEKAVATRNQSVETLRGMMEKCKPMIQMALPSHLTGDRMLRMAMTALQKNPKLYDCAPVTVIGAVVCAAQLGLEIDDGTGKAYLVPFWNSSKSRLEAQMIIGYKGLMQLANNTGMVGLVQAHTVHLKDEFTFSYGTDKHLKHIPSRDADRGPAVAYYAIAFLPAANADFRVIFPSDIEKVKEFVKKKNKGKLGPAWTDNEDAMGEKTAIRRLARFLPSSPENNRLQRAVSLDERAEAGIPQDLGLLVDASETGTPEEGAEPAKPALAEPKEKASVPALAAPQQGPKQSELPPGDAQEPPVNEYEGTVSEVKKFTNGKYEILDVGGMFLQCTDEEVAMGAKALKGKAVVYLYSNIAGKPLLVGIRSKS